MTDVEIIKKVNIGKVADYFTKRFDLFPMMVEAHKYNELRFYVFDEEVDSYDQIGFWRQDDDTLEVINMCIPGFFDRILPYDGSAFDATPIEEYMIEAFINQIADVLEDSITKYQRYLNDIKTMRSNDEDL